MTESVADGLPEARLLNHVRRLERNPFDWRAAHLHLSRLQASNRLEYKLRVAASEFESLLRRFEGEVFRLTDGDLVVLCKDASIADMDGTVLRLRYLFSDDPLASAASVSEPEDDPDREPRLCTWYSLDKDYYVFSYACEALLTAVEARHAASGASAATAPAGALDARTLVFAEHGVRNVDCAGLLRRQSICTVPPDEPPQAVFTELYVAIDALAKALGFDVDLTGNKWLFQHLTAVLDERLLAIVAAGAGGGGADEGLGLSLNLNLATLLTPAFARFTDEVRGGVGRERFLIELQLIDVYADLGAYVFARDLVRSRGGMVCLDGLHHLHLPLVDRARLGADFVKVQWSADLLDDVNKGRREELRAAITRTGVEQIILCRCGSPEAVRWGQELGVQLFQGRYIDSRLRAQRSPSIAAARQAIRSAVAAD